jgi:D-alanyl-D-alanine dipeptidase
LDPLAHAHRQALLEAMASAGFTRHPEEWWHFSYGDQMWAWLSSRASGTEVKARYGRADLI